MRLVLKKKIFIVTAYMLAIECTNARYPLSRLPQDRKLEILSVVDLKVFSCTVEDDYDTCIEASATHVIYTNMLVIYAQLRHDISQSSVKHLKSWRQFAIIYQHQL